jgi:hypothetical protein
MFVTLQVCHVGPLIANWLDCRGRDLDCLAQQWNLARLCFKDSSTDCPSSPPIQCTCSPLDATLMETLRQVS